MYHFLTKPQININQILLSLVLTLMLYACGSNLSKDDNKEIADSNRQTIYQPDPNIDFLERLPKVKLEKSYQKEFNKALKLIKNKQQDNAVTVLNKLVIKYPNYSGPLVNLSLININKKQYEDAEKQLNQALTIYPKNPYALALLAYTKKELGQFNESKKLYLKSLKLNPNHATTQYNFAILAELYLKDLELAKRHFIYYQMLQENKDNKVKVWITDLTHRMNR